MKPLFDIDDIMPGSLDGRSFCSPETYNKIYKHWPPEYGILQPDIWCPNHTKLNGRGQKKIYALVYRCLEGRVDTYLISGVYDWRKK